MKLLTLHSLYLNNKEDNKEKDKNIESKINNNINNNNNELGTSDIISSKSVVVH
jgi:hypothetical protein